MVKSLKWELEFAFFRLGKWNLRIVLDLNSGNGINHFAGKWEWDFSTLVLQIYYLTYNWSTAYRSLFNSADT